MRKGEFPEKSRTVRCNLCDVPYVVKQPSTTRTTGWQHFLGMGKPQNDSKGHAKERGMRQSKYAFLPNEAKLFAFELVVGGFLRGVYEFYPGKSNVFFWAQNKADRQVFEEKNEQFARKCRDWLSETLKLSVMAQIVRHEVLVEVYKEVNESKTGFLMKKELLRKRIESGRHLLQALNVQEIESLFRFGNWERV